MRRALPTCPACGRALGRRCRGGALEFGLSLVRIYPFRCAGCAYRFFAFRPGERYRPRPGARRIVDRVPVAVPCDVTTKDGVIAGTFVEVSLQGGAVDTHPAPAPGTEVSVVLHATHVDRPVKIAKAVVRWSRPGRFGLKFDTILPEDAARLRQVVLAARGYSSEVLHPRAPRRRSRAGIPWVVVAAVTAAILATLAYSLKY